jgi:hypothetical protein
MQADGRETEFSPPSTKEPLMDMPTIERSASLAPIDFDLDDPAELAAAIRRPGFGADGVGRILSEAFARSGAAGYRVAKALAATAASREQFVAEGTALFRAARSATPQRRRHVMQGMLDAAGTAAGLFLVHSMSRLKAPEARACMKDYLAAGGAVADVASWLRLSGQVLRKGQIRASSGAGVGVVEGVGDVAEWVLEALEAGAGAVLDGIDAIIDALTSAGATLATLVEFAATWTADAIADLLVALIERGAKLGEYIAATFDWAYDAVRNFVAAALQVGFDVAALIEQTVGQSYFVLRRYVDAVFRLMGSAGAVLDATLTLIERGAALAWRSVLLALRYAGADLLRVLDWMAAQSQATFNALLAAWESIGEALITVYQWALTAGSLAWQMIGEATQTIGNSVYYTYNFLAESGVEYIFDFSLGALRAKIAITTVIGWALGQGVEICIDVLRAVFEVGTTVAGALWAMATQPASAWQTFVQALLATGRTLRELMQAVLVETAQEYLAVVIDALLTIGQSVRGMLVATLEAGAAFVAVVLAELCSRLGTYRSLSAAERADAMLVFGPTLDYDNVFLSFEDPLNVILFGIQDFFNGNDGARAFVTMNLVNFKASDSQIDRGTLIHELTHVWQSRQVGGIYMAQALAAQTVGAGYNYGYRADFESFSLSAGATGMSATVALPVTPDTVAIYIDGGSEPIAADDGAGNIVFKDSAGHSGTIDYGNGQISLSFATALVADAVFTVAREVSLQIDHSGQPSAHQPEGFCLGVSADAALNAAAGNFDAFNAEQQGQITMHWFLRRFGQPAGNSGAALSYPSTAWDPYQVAVATA